MGAVTDESWGLDKWEQGGIRRGQAWLKGDRLPGKGTCANYHIAILNGRVTMHMFPSHLIFIGKHQYTTQALQIWVVALLTKWHDPKWPKYMGTCEIALRWMTQNISDDKSTLVQVMAWCRQTTTQRARDATITSSLRQYDVADVGLT